MYQKFVPGSVTSLAFSSPEPYLMLGIGGGDELGVLTVLVPWRFMGILLVLSCSSTIDKSDTQVAQVKLRSSLGKLPVGPCTSSL